MKSFVAYLAVRALGIEPGIADAPSNVPEPPLPPLATTPERAAAWRRWAESDGAPMTAAGSPATDPATANFDPVPTRARTEAAG